ncbi:MAG: hypothetical protein H0U82_08600 [Actinobacteria bacterium]|nr:hypothetical protein [Actinomycetota bacterium]
MLSTTLTSGEDAFGHLLSDLLAGCQAVEVVERDDGCIFTSDPSFYLAPLRSWWPQERHAMRLVRGRVLDLGCGAGRAGLHLQNRGQYRQYATRWYDVLFASREEVVQLAEGTGWVVSRFIDDGPGYVAVLDLVRRPRSRS